MTGLQAKKIVCDIDGCGREIFVTSKDLTKREFQAAIVEQGWLVIETNDSDTHVCHHCKYIVGHVQGVSSQGFTVTQLPKEDE